MDRVSVDTRVPGLAIVSLEGEHELYGALKLQHRLESIVAEGLDLVVDLSETSFMDSSIISVLLQMRDTARRADVRYVLVMSGSTGDSVRRMFEITGLARILPVIEHDERLQRAS
jgi:anti-anti-sigma factor